MSKYRECKICGAALDPGEKCDCSTEQELALRCTRPPVILENLDSVRQNLEILLAEVSAYPSNDDSLKKVKQIRADLAREFDVLETQRKAVKRQVMEPYDQAEKKYKDCISGPYKAADAILKQWVDGYQDGMKQKCEDYLREYFAELCQSLGIDFLKFEDCGVVVDMALARQKEPRKAIDKIFDFVTAVRTDLDVIMTMEDADEILAEYRNYLTVAQAVRAVNERKETKASMQAYLSDRKQWQEQQSQHRALLADVMPEAQPEPEEMCAVAFLATGTLSALKAMKAHALALGVTLEEITQEDEK